MTKTLRRCHWATTELGIIYHDTEWGVPRHDERTLFEFLILEGAQAGLSWETILKKRQAYRKAFDRFDPKKVAAYNAARIRTLLNDPSIIRNRLKIQATVQNAKAFLAIQKEYGSFDKYLWGFVDGKPVQNSHRSFKTVPARTDISDMLSKDLLKRGFKFVGSTICYAYMQAIGMVNDHAVDCFRYSEVRELAAR